MSSGGLWDRYDADESAKQPIFWVGVGIDNMSAFELAQAGGLHSVEVGFYYNSEFVRPYTGAAGTPQSYRELLEQNVLGPDSKNQWPAADYAVTSAVPDAGRQLSDPETREKAPGAGWQLTYVSLQKQEGSAAANRFAGFSASDKTTQYIMMIPFQVQKYDPNQALCFMLARDATLFSIGGGREGWTMGRDANGVSSYGAWERETRNPGHNLKEMLSFNGDLNIFTGQKVKDDEYTATLELRNAVAGDSVVMTRAGDVNSPQITGTETPPDNRLGGLLEGSVVDLQVTCDPGTRVEVRVVGTTAVTVNEVTRDSHYTFKMPDSDVVVTVEFHHDPGNVDYRATLDVVDPDHVAENKATLSNGTDSVPGNGGEMTLTQKVNTPMTVTVGRHPDYDAKVTVMAGMTEIATTPGAPTAAGEATYTFSMPSSNVVVTVEYEKAPLHTVELIVDSDAGGSVDNQAMLSYRAWDWVDGTDDVNAWEGKTSILNGRVGGNESLQVRSGRELTVSVNLSPGYTAKVEMLPKTTGGTVQTLLLAANPTEADFDWSTVFAMPDGDAEVKVTFTQVAIRKVTAESYEADNSRGNYGEADNYFTLTANGQTANSIPDNTATPPVLDHIDVMAGASVTVDLHAAAGYHVERVQVVKVNPDGTDGDLISYSGSIVNNNITFLTPADTAGDPARDVDVRVTYSPGEVETLTATLEWIHLDPLGSDLPTDGWWNDNNIHIYPTVNAREGDKLLAELVIQPGWYIKSATVVGASGSYSRTLSGDGWGNGRTSAVTETVRFNMPGEDVKLHVEVAKGPPPEEKTFAAGLQVTGPTGVPGNWAQMTVNGGAAQPVPAQTADAAGPYYAHVHAGDKIEVHFDVAPGYRIVDVILGPGNHQSDLNWHAGGRDVDFTQWSEDTTVTVIFEEGDPEPDRKATLHLVNAQGADSGSLTNPNTQVTDPPYSRTTSQDNGYVNAFPGDTIEIEALASTMPTRYVQAIYVLPSGSITPILPVNSGAGRQSGSFVMPGIDVDVYVVFSDKQPDPNAHAATLTVTDLSGGAVGDAGSAVMTRSGGPESVTVQSEGPHGMLSVPAGETVTVTVSPKLPNYTIATVKGVPSGSIHLNWTGNIVTFTMPAENAAVEVVLQEGNSEQYTANIVLHSPTTPPQLAGDAWFSKDVNDNSVYSRTAVPGENVPVHIEAQPGYMIDTVTVTGYPGVTVNLPGVYGRQEADFTMPAGNVTVNVTFKAGWPDEGMLQAVLQVEGPAGSGAADLKDTTAGRVSSTGSVGPDSEARIQAQDGDKMVVEILPAPHYRVKEITVKNAEGSDVPYHYSGTDQITFDMPGSKTTVKVIFEEGDPISYDAILTYGAGGTAVLENTVTGASVGGNNDRLPAKAGELLTLNAQPASGYRLAAVLVTAADGSSVPLSGGIVGNRASVVMQDQEITVEAIFVDEGEFKDDEYAAFLRLMGPAGAGTGVITAANGNTANVGACPGSTYVAAKAGEKVTAEATPNSGYLLFKIDVALMDNTVISYTPTGAGKIEFTMPGEDAVVTAVFQKDPQKTYTAQVVVDKGGATGADQNTAFIYRADGTPPTAADKAALLSAEPWEKLKVDIHPAPGYVIQLVEARPSERGVVLTGLTPLLDRDQTVEFYMPVGNVEIFVRFAPDQRTRLPVNLTVDHADGLTPNPNNKASVHSGFSGTKGPIIDDGSTATAYAANTEVVTITVDYDATYYSVRIEALGAADGMPVSNVAQISDTQYQFPMPAQAVDVRVIYYVGEDDYRAYLHIDEPAGATGNTASITQADDSSVTTNVDLGYIDVPAGKTIDLKAAAGAGYFVKDAYVVYDKTVIKCDPDDLGNVASSFLMQAGDVHVYVVFGPESEKPDELQYAATLTVTDLTGGGVGVAGTAVMSRSGGPETVTVKSNERDVYTVNGNPVSVPRHAPLTAAPGETLTVTVTVEPGYELDSVIITPLEYAIPAVPTGNLNEYTFTMPAHNVGAEVRLKRGSDDGIYTARLHYIAPLDASQQLAGGNAGSIAYGSTQLATQNNETIRVPGGGTVAVTATPAADWYVKKAYVISGTEMIALDPLLEGSENKTGEEAKTFPASFVMPTADADVYMEFAEGPAPAVTEYTAALIMTDPSGNRTNSGILTDSTTVPPASVTVINNSGHGAINALRGDEMVVELRLDEGYEVDTITITPPGPGGTSIRPTPDPGDPNRYTFTMPNYDVLVSVVLKSTDLNEHTATLVVVDGSSAIGNVVTITDGTTTLTGNGATITGLLGTERITANVTLQPQVAVSDVIITNSQSGSHPLTFTPGTTSFYTDMIGEDVTITVILVNDPNPDPHLHKATVTINDADHRPGNRASISNPTEPSLPNGAIWTQAHTGNTVRVDFQTESGYFVKVTGTSPAMMPLQLGTTGSGYAIFTMPDSDLEIEVLFTKDKEELGEANVTLAIAGDHDGSALNRAELTAPDGVTAVEVTGAAPTPQTLTALTPGDNMSLMTGTDGATHVKSVEISVGGISQNITLSGGGATVPVPVGNATVTVTFEDGAQSNRPYDPNHATGYAPYIEGYLDAENLGSSKAHIIIPTLRTDGGTYKSANEASYTFYYFDGKNYIKLVEGADYESFGFTDYDTAANYGLPGIVGTQVTIRALVPGSPLAQYMAKGGVIYVTSTERDSVDPGQSLAESEYVDVVIPADPFLGKHKATLQIVDISGVAGNTAALSDGHRTVTVSGKSLTGLLGTELLKTEAVAASDARLVSVCVSDSAGTRLLSEDPAGTGRYPYTMKNEDVVITVTFGPKDDLIYTATVTRVGHRDLPGNTVEIHNTTLAGTLPEGTIWANGRASDVMELTINTEPNYYAKVEAVRKSDHTKVGVIPLGVGGDGVPFQALLTMPADDVEITVTYSTDPPETARNPLTLTMNGVHDSLAGNQATVTGLADGDSLAVLGTGPLTVTTADGKPVTAGTKLHLAVQTVTGTGIADSYYVEKAVLKVFDDAGNQVGPNMTITLNGSNEADVVMPQGRAEIVVSFAKGVQMPRPFDPDHDIPAGSTDAGTEKDGRIVAVNLGNNAVSGLPELKVVVPALSPDDGTTLENATPNVGYKFYLRDSYGNYTYLDASQLQVSTPVAVPGATTTGVEMTLTALVANSQLAYNMKRGGTMYITAVDEANPAEKGESRYTQVDIPANYTATLYIRGNGLPSVGSGVVLEAQDTGKSTNVDGGVISGLGGTENLTTTVTLAAGEKIAAVVVTEDGGGSYNLTASSGGVYDYTMVSKDVAVTVVLAPETDPDDGPTYVLAVQQTYDPIGTPPKAGNTAVAKNGTVAGLPTGNIWAVGYENDRMVVTVTTEPGWYAKVTSCVRAGTAPAVPVPYTPWGVTGVFDVELDMPASNVDLVITYSQNKPDPSELVLKIAGDYGTDANNYSVLTWGTPASQLMANPTAPSASGTVDAGEAMALTANHGADYHVEKVEITTASGMTTKLLLTGGKGTFPMPADATVVTVTYAEGAATPRPYDPDHHIPADPGTQPGWILAENKGAGKLTIQVPTLSEDGVTYEDAFASLTYKLYLAAGSSYVELTEGTDYTLLSQTAGSFYGTLEGTELQLEALSGKMKELLIAGGTLYITATDTKATPAKAESELTEVIVKPRGEEHTATLRIVDWSSGTLSTVTMTDGTTSVSNDGDSFQTGGASTLTTTVALANKTRVVSVIATNDNGSHRVSPNNLGAYLWDMDDQDTTITVILENTESPDPLYTATVSTTGDDGQPGNTADVVNVGNPVLPNGDIWTNARSGNAIEVHVTTADGYYAVITAKDTAGNTVQVFQVGKKGNVTGYLTMPAADVEILVTYTKTAPGTSLSMSLTVTGATSAGTGSSWAALEYQENGIPRRMEQVDNGNQSLLTLDASSSAETLTISAEGKNGDYVDSVILSGHGVDVRLTLDSSGRVVVPMPLGGASVTVTFAKGTRTPRPYDPDHAANHAPYIEGYLAASDNSNGRFTVEIPTLYDRSNGRLSNATDADAFTFYTWDGQKYIRLLEGVDYEVTARATGSNTYGGTGYTSEILTLHVLKGESALAQVVNAGGVIYVTSTSGSNRESEYVDVVLEADPKAGYYTATLRIDDPLSTPGNSATLWAGGKSVTDGGVITGLTGLEQLKTNVTAAPTSRLLGVTVTDNATGATRWLAETPSGTLRFPYFMHNEDVTVTVRFAGDDDLYIATVDTVGYTGVTGLDNAGNPARNTASVTNGMRSSLRKGVIWAEGYVGDSIKVHVETVSGYYARLSAVREDNGGVVAVYPIAGGDGVAFDAVLTMPAANVQIVVDFTTEKPEDWESDLILALVDHGGEAGNTASVASTGVTPTITLTADGSDPLKRTTAEAQTQFELTTKAEAGYYVEKAVITEDGKGNKLATPVVIQLDVNGAGKFVMPVKGAKVEVYYKAGERTPRPYDVANDRGDPPGTQRGWLEGKRVAGEPDAIQVVIPMLSDDGNAFENADQVDFRFYARTSYPSYNELVVGTDIKVEVVDPAVTTTHNGTTYTGVELKLTALSATGILQYYIREGGVIYATAEDTATPRGESDYTELVIPADRTATLHIEQGSLTGNAADITSGTKTAAIDPSDPSYPADVSLTGLADNATVTVTATPVTGARVKGVVATTASGSVNLTDDGSGNYTYTMAGQDVTITVVFQPEDDPRKDWYIAAVTKDDGELNLAGNDADITNQDHTTPEGDIWAAGYVGDTMGITVTTEPGWSAIVTAHKHGDENTTVPVVQWDVTGSFLAQITMPDYDVDVVVTYTQALDPAAFGDLTLRVKEDDNNAWRDRASLAVDWGTVMQVISDDTPTHWERTMNQVTPGLPLDLTTIPVAGRHVASAVLRTKNSDGSPGLTVTLNLLGGASSTTMPLSDTDVEVTFAAGEKSARPYDPDHVPAAAPGSQPGWLLAENQGGGLLTITVPTLTEDEGASLNNAYFAQVKDVYKLYWRNALGNYKTLTWDTDYTLVGDPVEVTNTYGGTEYKGVTYTIRVNNTNGDLDLRDVANDGGTLWITATEAPKLEGDWTQVIVPAPESDDTYTATLVISDSSTPPAGEKNTIVMRDGKGLFVDDTSAVKELEEPSGEELTTTVTLAGTAKIKAVVATTASGGSTYLTMEPMATPGDPQFKYTMPSEDVTITVILTEEDDLSYPVVVKKNDLTGDTANNTADIENTSDPTAASGDIWTMAQAKDHLKVSFDSPHYVYVEAIRVDENNDPVGGLLPLYQSAITGSGVALLDMPDPAQKVLVTVTYSDIPPEDAELILTLTGHAEKPENSAAVHELTVGTPPTPPAVGAELVSNAASAGALDPLSVTAAQKVTPGDDLRLSATHHTDYYIKSVTLKTSTGYMLPLTLTALNTTDTAMQIGGMELIVEFAEGKYSPRPYDPAHETPEDPGTQAGWLEGVNQDNGTALVTVPTLMDETEKVPDGLHDVVKDTVFRFYLYDENTLTYELLEEKKDYTLRLPDDSADGYTLDTYYTYNNTDPYTGAQFLLGEVAGGKLEGEMLKGVTLYVTAQYPAGTEGTETWVESHMTELIIPPSTAALRPYDPDRVNVAGAETIYKDYWIRGENRGDYAIITVPTLADSGEANANLSSVDPERHDFKIYLGGEPDDDGNPTYVDLSHVVDLVHPDPDNAAANETYYENGVYYTKGETKYNGARFILQVKTSEELQKLIDDNAVPAGTTLADLENLAGRITAVLDNNGTGNESGQERLYITAVTTTPDPEDVTAEPTVYESEKVDLEIPQYYALSSAIEAYAPQHAGKAVLYRLKNGEDPTLPESYEEEPAFQTEIVHETGLGLWEIPFKIKSSELPGYVYKLEITKPGHVSYTWLGLDLALGNLNEATPECRTFTTKDYIPLFGGDVDGDGQVKIFDREILIDYFSGNRTYTTVKPEDAATDPDGWLNSICNPEGLAYATDLDGDGNITVLDLSILMDARNDNKTTEDNVPPPGLRGEPVTLSLREEEEAPEETPEADGVTEEEAPENQEKEENAEVSEGQEEEKTQENPDPSADSETPDDLEQPAESGDPEGSEDATGGENTGLPGVGEEPAVSEGSDDEKAEETETIEAEETGTSAVGPDGQGQVEEPAVKTEIPGSSMETENGAAILEVPLGVKATNG